MNGRPSTQYIVVSDSLFWQMVAAKWMGQFVELAASIYPEAWCPYWQNYEHFYAGECMDLGSSQPQVDDPHADTQAFPMPVSSNLDVKEPVDEHQTLEKPDEIVEPEKDCEASPGTVASCIDAFDNALLEHSMRCFASRDEDSELQVDWNMCGAGTINLADMGADEAGHFPTRTPATNVAVPTDSHSEHAARHPFRASALSVPYSGPDTCCAEDFDNGFFQHHRPMLSSEGDAAFDLGQAVQLHSLKNAQYNQKHGKIHTRRTADGRQGVQLACGKIISVKISNLRPVRFAGDKGRCGDDLKWPETDLAQCKLWCNNEPACGQDGEGAPTTFRFPPNSARPCTWP
eukprot:Skav203912  [mRNA]  locus=scaffold228:115753:116787:- [translate_table: standard]